MSVSGGGGGDGRGDRREEEIGARAAQQPLLQVGWSVEVEGQQYRDAQRRHRRHRPPHLPASVGVGGNGHRSLTLRSSGENGGRRRQCF